MKNLKKDVVRQYIIDCIDLDGYEGNFPGLSSKVAKVAQLVQEDAFYHDELKRFNGNHCASFRHCMDGLPSYLTLSPYPDYTSPILAKMAEFGLPLPENKEEEDGVELYWTIVYNAFKALCAEFKINLEAPQARAVAVTYANGQTIKTSLAPNLTDKQIRDYFAVGKPFPFGEDELSEVTKVLILR